jgi:hypothetical protein
VSGRPEHQFDQHRREVNALRGEAIHKAPPIVRIAPLREHPGALEACEPIAQDVRCNAFTGAGKRVERIQALEHQVAYLVPTFPLGYAWHLVAFREHYERLGLYRAQVIIPFGLGSMFVQAALFAWLYPRVFSTGRDVWVSSGAAFALVFGVLGWPFTTLPVAAKYKMSSIRSFLLLESAFTVLQFLLVAPLIALAWRDRL